MTEQPTRRAFLAGSVALLLASRLQAAPRAQVEQTRVISWRPDLYHGWPTLARRRNGQLLLVCSGGREGHVCPFGRVELMTSGDDGKSWTFPRVLLDTDLDDRDAGVLETPAGSLLVTTFTSLAYEPILERAEKLKPGEPGSMPADRLARWQAARDRLPAEQRRRQLGTWMIRSTDGGLTWSARYDCLVNSPHGPIALADGRLLHAGKELWTDKRRNGVCLSTDDGQSWHWLAEIPTRSGDNPHDYHELHAVETGRGRLIVHIRNHNPANAGELLQSESDDGGKTWSIPHPIGVWGLPAHLLRLRDGRLLLSYGHRRPPFGNQARLSSDEGKSWSEPLTVSGDGAGGDLGYPSTVELGDGALLTVWYEKRKESPRAVLRQAHWKLQD